MSVNENEIAKPKTSQLSPKQQEIVDYYGTNLLVSASAGSGKTRVVISKLIDIIKKGYKKEKYGAEVNQLLVTTFTKAAGTQMLSKLASSLSDLVVESQGEEQLYYMKQLEDLSQAHIGTLHTFCEKLIKKYFYAVNIEPNFRILEEKDSDFFKNQVLDDLFEDYTDNDDKLFFEVLETFKNKRSLVEFKRSLNNLLSFIKAKEGYVDFLKVITSKLQTSNESIEKILNNYLLERKGIINLYYNEFLKESEYIYSDKIQEYLRKNIEILNTVNSENNFIENFKNFKNMKFIMLSSAKKGLTVEELELKDKIRNFNKDKRSKLIDLKLFDNIDIDSVKWISNKGVQDKLIEILQKFNERYSELKLDKNFMDFNDLEEYSIKILNIEELRKSIESKFKFVFVDEYQDTNEIQESILTKISNGKNMIMVGDVKQSIYGFRNTSPEIFLKKYNDYQNNLGGKLLDLNKNYRSRKPILDYCNYLFDTIMTEKTCDIDYKKEHAFSVEKDEETYKSSVEFHIIDTSYTNTKKELKDLYSVTDECPQEDDKEIDLLINLINKTLKEKIYDSETKEYRQCKYKDISVLCRVSDNVDKISQKFMELKIPFTAKYKINLYKEEEINLVLSILSLIQNDYNDIALTTCLSSYIFNITNNELFKIRKTFKNEKFFYLAVKKYSEIEDDLGQKLRNFYSEIEDLRNLEKIVQLKELVENIYTRYNIIPYYSFRKDGRIKVKNLYTYLDTLKDGFYTQNLTAYLNYCYGYAINDSFDIVVNGGDNSIQIQTIHASKGLEYNVIFLYGIEKRYNMRSTSERILKDKDLGIALKETDIEDNTEEDTLSRIALKIKIAEQSIKEEMRLLYVALTRAKYKLIVLGKGNLDKLDNYETFYEVKNSNSYFNLMLKSLKKESISALQNGKALVNYANSPFFYISYIPENIAKVEQKDNLDEYDEEYNEQKLKEILDFSYCDIEATTTRLKNTVTALQEEDDTTNIDFSVSKTNIDNNEEQISALERGNSYHFIMKESNLDIQNLDKLKQLPDFKNVEEDKIVKCILTMSELAKNRKIISEKMFLMNVPKSKVKENSKTDTKILIQGIADLILEGENDILLIDYKTTKGSNSFLKEKYRTQLSLYALAVSQYYNKPVKCKYIYSFSNNCLIETE